MTAAATISIIAEVTGLGEGLVFGEKFAVTTTIIKAVLNRQIQTTAATAEVLNKCGIGKVELVIIKATTNNLYIDTDCTNAGAFVKDSSIDEGECRIIKPDGTNGIFINGAADKACTIDYLIVGST